MIEKDLLWKTLKGEPPCDYCRSYWELRAGGHACVSRSNTSFNASGRCNKESNYSSFRLKLELTDE